MYPFDQPTEEEKVAIKARKLADNTERLNRILETLQADGVVTVTTYTNQWEYSKKHIAMFRASASGLYVQRGRKAWDCIDGCAIRHYKRVAQAT